MASAVNDLNHLRSLLYSRRGTVPVSTSPVWHMQQSPGPVGPYQDHVTIIAPQPVHQPVPVYYSPPSPMTQHVTQVVNIVSPDAQSQQNRAKDDEEKKQDTTAADLATCAAIDAGIVAATGWAASAYNRSQLRDEIDQAFQKISPSISYTTGEQYRAWKRAAFPSTQSTAMKIGASLSGFTSIILGLRFDSSLGIYFGSGLITGVLSWQVWDWMTTDEDKLLDRLINSIETELCRITPPSY